MPKYKFVTRYVSGAGQFGAGQVVEMDAERAAWFNRDAPGCLVPVVDEPPAERAPEAPAHDRMMKPRGRRKAAKE